MKIKKYKISYMGLNIVISMYCAVFVNKDEKKNMHVEKKI